MSRSTRRGPHVPSRADARPVALGSFLSSSVPPLYVVDEHSDGAAVTEPRRVGWDLHHRLVISALSAMLSRYMLSGAVQQLRARDEQEGACDCRGEEAGTYLDDRPEYCHQPSIRGDSRPRFCPRCAARLPVLE